MKTVTFGALLHDIGKVIHRGRDIDGRSHSVSGTDWVRQYTQDQQILDCIRFHHHQEIAQAKLKEDNPAYVVYLADNISSGVDRREIEGEEVRGFNKNRSLESIYNLLNCKNNKYIHNVAEIKDSINYPEDPLEHDYGSAYNNIIFGMTEGMRGIDFTEEYANSLLELFEAYLSYVPSSTYLGEVADISLFDHAKTTAAIASCIVLYLEAKGRTNYQKELFQNRNDFYQEDAFSLLSIDISGIQQFIYTISSKGALKGLRSRSFYLEILLENLVDELLTTCSLSRANLLYTGGGHAYILVPNTKEAREKIEATLTNTNKKLLECFGARIFIAYGLQECSANDLMAKGADPECYANIFRGVASQISAKKLRRYSPQDIRYLNSTTTDKAGRECKICGVSSNLVKEKHGEDIVCKICGAFAEISGLLVRPEWVFVVLKEELAEPSLPLFSAQGQDLFLYAFDTAKAKELLQNKKDKVVRIYSKNIFRTGFSLATKLWISDYASKNEEGALMTFADLAQNSTGVKRIGVLRADVDNLGLAFVEGFLRKDSPENKYRYVTISRTATLSRSLSIFFKYYLNHLLKNGEHSLTGKTGQRNIVVVYSGGDDMFLVGAWDEVLAAAIDIRQAFKKYTGDALTISAGFAAFEPSYPISRMALETAELEKRAKEHKYQDKTKNSISLFGLEMQGGQLSAQHTYDWDTFEDRVLGEKYASIVELFSTGRDYGNTFLYNILNLLREAENDSINLARLAYLLARREPEKNASPDIKDKYAKFSRNLYQWALNKEDRRQFITALLIYIYSRREEKEESKNG